MLGAKCPESPTARPRTGIPEVGCPRLAVGEERASFVRRAKVPLGRRSIEMGPPSVTVHPPRVRQWERRRGILRPRAAIRGAMAKVMINSSLEQKKALKVAAAWKAACQ